VTDELYWKLRGWRTDLHYLEAKLRRGEIIEAYETIKRMWKEVDEAFQKYQRLS